MKAKELCKTETNFIKSLFTGTHINARLSIEKDVKDFFAENKDLEYSEFLKLYEEKFGNIISHQRKIKKYRALQTIKAAAIIYIVLICLSVFFALVYLVLEM